MSNLTQKAIKNSVLKLLNEKPFNQITIKDVVDDCGINRNTFYYHFRDLPSLVEEMVTEQADDLISRYPSVTSLKEAIDAAASFAMQNKKAAYHIYNSVSRDIYETYLWRICEYVCRTYIESVFEEYGIKDSEALESVILFYKCACFGVVMDWQRNGMKSDITDQLLKLYEIKKDVITELAEKLGH